MEEKAKNIEVTGHISFDCPYCKNNNQERLEFSDIANTGNELQIKCNKCGKWIIIYKCE